MGKIIATVQSSVLVRVLILAAVALAIGWMFLPAYLKLATVYYFVTPLGIAIAAGGTLGFITFKLEAFLITTILVFLACFMILIHGPF